MSVAKPGLEPAAGFSLESPANRPDRVPLKKGEYSIASRALALSTYFLSGALAINLSQFLGAPLYLVNQDWYNAWIAFTKQSFGLLTMTLTQTFAPTKVIISGDASVRGQLLQSTEGDLILNFPERLVLIANHQIYTDWLYLWWIAYCNGMHGRLYIILKESLKKIPVLGWGMQFNQFIFLKRKWEQDKPNMASALQRLNRPTDPMWLLLFPEGTNLAASTRAKSAAWAAKNNIPDMKHVLLPRSTGLHFCLEELKGTVDYVYDCTIAYEGVPRGAYAQDIFTLKAGYLEGRPPKSVSMHWRRFAIKDIPLHNEKAFELWLIARWREKDLLMEQYLQTGSFPADKGATKYKSGKVLRGCGHMEVPIRASHWYEFLQIFAPMGILAMVLYIFYGDLPQRFWKSINKQALQSGTEDIKQAGIKAGKSAKSVSNSLSGLTLDSFFEPTKQEEGFKAGAMAVQKLLNSPSAQTLLSRADFIQQFLSDPQKMVTDSITSQQQNFMRQLAMEEARRQQSRMSAPPVGPAKPVTNGTVSKKGTFWDALEAEEKSRHGSIVSAPSSTTNKKSKGTFWQELKAAEEKKGGPRLTEAAKQSLGGQKKATFWDDIKAEENSRYGTVVTLSSNASTAVASDSSKSTRRAAPKLGTPRAASTVGNPPNKAPSVARSVSTTSSQQTRPASSTLPKAPRVQPPKGSTGPKSVSKTASATPATSTPANTSSAKLKSAVPSNAPSASKPSSTKTSNTKTSASNTKPGTGPSANLKSNGISKTPTVTSNKQAGIQTPSTRPDKKSTTTGISGTSPNSTQGPQKSNTNLQTGSKAVPPNQGTLAGTTKTQNHRNNHNPLQTNIHLRTPDPRRVLPPGNCHNLFHKMEHRDRFPANQQDESLRAATQTNQEIRHHHRRPNEHPQAHSVLDDIMLRRNRYSTIHRTGHETIRIPVPCQSVRGHHGCEYLQHKIEKRMEQMAAGQIHSEDVRCLFLSVEPQVDEDMKKFLAEHVAIRIWEKRLKAKGAYRTLREEIPEFNKMIDGILGKKVEQRKMEWEARRKKRLAGQGNHGLNGRSSGATYGRGQGNRGLDVNGPEHSSGALAAYDGKPGSRVSGTAGKSTLTPTPTPAPTEPKAEKVSTVKVQSPVVRRGRNGRPAFVRFDLGVTRDGVRAAGGQT
ncbi:hypothetical protein HRR81_000589 [Exophiala dermatitidis]|nr:hypothetical protein HRR81_000589 [Exophiala dermatitidis]